MKHPNNDIHKVANDLATQVKAAIAEQSESIAEKLKEETRRSFLLKKQELVEELSAKTAEEIKRNVLNKYTAQNKIESSAETIIYRSRWLMMPDRKSVV